MKPILFVDDQAPSYVEILYELQDRGLQHELAPSFDYAARLVVEKEYSAILLDIMGPTGEGFDEAETREGLETGLVFIQRLRTGRYGDANKSTPVLVYTNNPDKGVHERALACGGPGTEALLKPWPPNVLIDRLQELAARHATQY